MSDKPPPPGCQGGSQDIRNRRLPSQPARTSVTGDYPASQPARAFVTEDYTATATTIHHSLAGGTASCSCGHVLRTMFAIPKEFKLHQSKSEHIWINSTFAKHRHKQEHICLVFFWWVLMGLSAFWPGLYLITQDCVTNLSSRRRPLSVAAQTRPWETFGAELTGMSLGENVSANFF